MQECHKKAWDVLGDFLQGNMQIFEGKSIEAESTVLPALSGWVKDTLDDLPSVPCFALFLH